MAYINNTVYWVGADGNIYTKGPSGTVENQGTPLGPNPLQDNGFDSNRISMEATRINDPNVPAAGGGGGGGGSSAAAAPVLNQGAVTNTQSTIDQIPGLLQAALASEAQKYNNNEATFDASQKEQQGIHDTGAANNQKNYDATYMDSIRSGIKGLGGLIAILRGTGAAGGSVEDQVRNTVGSVTANDIATGGNTYQDNQGQLDQSLGSFLTDLQDKRRQDKDTLANNESSIRRDSATQLQDLYGKMAGFYGDAGNTGAANDWMARAGSLTPTIAANTTTQVSPYDTTPVVVHAPNLTAFQAPTQPSVVTSPSDNTIGSGIFTMSKRKQSSEPAPAPVPAVAGA